MIERWAAQVAGAYRRWKYQERFQVVDETLRLTHLPAEELDRVAWARLHDLLVYAHNAIPFYQETFRARGVTPETIRSWDDFAARVPILTKRDIQEHLDRLVAPNRAELGGRVNHTGGSTGEPLTFYQDDNYRAHSSAGFAVLNDLFGMRHGDRTAWFWGSDYDNRAHETLRGRLRDRFLNNTLHINTFDLDRARAIAALRRLRVWRPDFILGYVSSLTMVARIAQDEGIELPPVRGVQTAAEQLTDPQRQLLQEVFGGPVFNRYGAREVGAIAMDCAHHHGLHIITPNNIVEVVDEKGHPAPPGQVGRILVTNLHNRAMPFIRYEIGDLGALSAERCPCGRGLPLLQEVIGRISDVIVSPGGKFLHGEFFTHLFYNVQGVRQFQVVQETRADLRVRIVPQSTETNLTAVEAFIRQTVAEHGDPAFRVHFEVVEHIPASPSGKHRFVRSEVWEGEDGR